MSEEKMELETSKLGRWQISYQSRNEFLELKKEIWVQGEYYVELDEDELMSQAQYANNCQADTCWAPTIVDVGAHIGLATLYWLNLWPKAQVLAIEANPINVEILKKNIAQNNLESQVKIVQGAVIGRKNNNEREKSFYFDQEGEWLMSGSLYKGAWNGQEKSQEIKVPIYLLSELIVPLEKVDLLKIDIEGMESEVLYEVNNKLRKIKRLLIEYHPRTKTDKIAAEELNKLQKFLEIKGFEIEIERLNQQLMMISGYNQSI